MAHPYSTEARLELLIGADRVAELLDRDDDDVDDTGLYTAAVERAANTIDARLKQRWTVPFNAITASTPTPGLIADLTDCLTAVDLYARENPLSQEVEYFRDKSDALLEGLLDGTFDIDAARVSAEQGQRMAAFSAAEPIFSGRDSSGVRRTRGF